MIRSRPRGHSAVEAMAATATMTAGDLPLVGPADTVVPASGRRPRAGAGAEAGVAVGGAERFRRIVEQNFDFIWRALRGLGVSSGSVDDAAQHVFLVASQKLDQILDGRERSFLLSTAVGVASNARRAQARDRFVLDDDAVAAQLDEAPDPEESASARERRRLLDAFLTALPIDLRTVFVLYELERLTMAEISDALGVPAGTVASRLRRAREEFHAAAKRFQSQRDGGAR